MNNKQINASLARAVAQDRPDTLGAVLRRCEAYDSSPSPLFLQAAFPQADERQKTKIHRMVQMAAAAAVFIFIFSTAWLGYGHFRVDSVIGFDVNPSIALNINRAEKVLSVEAFNADAEIVLDGMELKNVDLNIAVNALIGSMLKNGYVSEIKNSILITVKNADSAKCAALQQRLSADVGSLLDAYSVGGAVLSQTLSEDEYLKALAAEHGISLGKAALVSFLVNQDARFQFADIAALSINDINLLLSGKRADIAGMSSNGQASSGAYIGEARAKAIALENAGAEEVSATFSNIKLDFDDGRMVYEADFFVGDAEYEYEIDALTGAILSRDIDRREISPGASMGAGAGAGVGTGAGAGIDADANSGTGASAGTGADSAYIGEARAGAAALGHAGLPESDVSRLRVKQDRENGGLAVYEVEFSHGPIEYEYEIDAATGEILEWDSDYDD